jgi:antitoxin YefM
MTPVPLGDLHDHLSDYVDQVEHEHERIVVTRDGRRVAVLISAGDFADLEQTLDVLIDPELADLRR